MVMVLGVTKLSSPKSLACFPNFNEYVIQSAYSRTELAFYLDAIKCIFAIVLKILVRQELLNLAVVQKMGNGCSC